LQIDAVVTYNRYLNAIMMPDLFNPSQIQFLAKKIALRMIKLTFCLTRLPHLTREQFQTYWRETHAPLVAAHKDVLRIRRYVQLHSSPVATSEGIQRTRGGPDGYDGVAELWWDSFEDMAKSGSDPEAAKAGKLLLEDERKFIDLPKSPLWWGEEFVVIR